MGRRDTSNPFGIGVGVVTWSQNPPRLYSHFTLTCGVCYCVDCRLHLPGMFTRMH